VGREVLQIKTPRFVQRIIFVTCDGAWTTIKNVEQEKSSGREGSIFVQSALDLFFWVQSRDSRQLDTMRACPREFACSYCVFPYLLRTLAVRIKKVGSRRRPAHTY
jgi:hypothetical protein